MEDNYKKRKMSDESDHEENNFETRTNWISGPAEIPKNEIKFESIISEEGGFGVVWRGTCRGTPVAIKVPRGPFTNKQLTDFRKEISILSRLYNPSICLFMGAHIGKDEVIIVSELMEGNVEELLKNKQTLSLYEKLNMCRDAARGIAWLHAQNPKVLHRDIKPSNFLYVKVNESYRIRVCDFGLSDLIPTKGIKENSPKGTPLYMAPEVLMTKRFNEKADVYSFGISLWQILVEEDPWKDIEKLEDLIDAVCVKHKRLPMPQNCPQSLKKLINKCWSPDPSNRPSFEEIISKINKIRVEAAIPVDISGQLFWRKHFGEKGKVKFKEWLQHFFNQYTYLQGSIPEDVSQNIPLSGYIGEINNVVDKVNDNNGEIDIQQIKLIFLRLLKVLFVTETKSKDEDIIDIEHYGRCLGWVGPIENNPFEFLIRLQKLYAQPWFFGMLPTPEATSLLLPSDTGTYLVRFCNTPNLPGYYVLSVVTTNNQEKKVVAHIRIKHSPGGTFSLEKIPGPEYDTLELLIEDCVKKMRLKKACLGRKYQLTYFETIAKTLQLLQNSLNMQKVQLSQDMNLSEDK